MRPINSAPRAGVPRTLLVLSMAFSLHGCGVNNPPSADGAVDPTGALRVPASYRETYEPAGTWSVAADNGEGAKEMHVVYASPGALEAYRRTGAYPDGSVLVKEVFATTTAAMTTGTASQPATLKGWFVMVRERHNSHPGDKRWGDGWGWGWFDVAKPQQTATQDYKTECLGCHEPARKTDLTYTHGYPVGQ